ncbi:hypothetical protein [Enterococcus ureasiticus]|uniref:Uncharacterized protein n=1 Tax=Enterococcus ureasiticus TaxID=903984 RepID=A0A1E5GH36_9ENTE|nr:hypothetical protein [Enterococcus ureasiticus]OEG12034.1 hypothetical protein BCR21_07295 [Enterococcus ureasiticus]
MPNMDGLEYRQIDFKGGKVWCWVKKGRTTADPEDIEKSFLFNDWVARMLEKYGPDYFKTDREKGVTDLLVEQNLRLFEEVRTGIDSKTGKKLTPAERLARGASLVNSLAALGVGAKQITNVGKGKAGQTPKKPPIVGSGRKVPAIGKPKKTISAPGKKIQSVKEKPSKVKAPVNGEKQKINIKDFEIKNKHLNGSTAKRARKFNVSTAEEANKIVEDALKNGKIVETIPNGVGSQGQNSFSRIIDTGKIVGTKGETYIKIVYDELSNVWTTYPVPKP